MIDDNKRQSETENMYKRLRSARELYELGQFDDASNIAQLIYQQSESLKENVLKFEAMIILAEIVAQLGNTEATLDLINKIENILESLSDDSIKEIDRKKAKVLRLKGNYQFIKGELDKAIKFHKQALSIQKKLGDKKEIALSLGYIGDGLALMGEKDQALYYLKESQKICKEFDLKSRTARNLITYSAIYYAIGDMKRSFDLINQSLNISEKINNKQLIALALNNLGGYYQIKGDLDSATKELERCLEVSEEIGFVYLISSVLDYLIQGAIIKGDQKLAEEYLNKLNNINEIQKSNVTNTLYRFNKALVLKTSLRARNRADAEDLLKDLINDESTLMETRIMALLNLCDLLLKELQLTGYLEILDELQQYISQLLEITEHNHYYLFMAETYFLQARLSLITLNLKESKRFFTQAQRIAEKWGFIQLSLRIKKEHEEFLKQFNKWEKLKETNASIGDRMELARIDEHIDRMLQNRAELTGTIIEDEVEIHKEKRICMICKGDVSGYIYVCECDAIYCENCVKALINLENACWVCEAPIDQSKPIKHYKKDELESKNKNKLKEQKESFRK